MGEKIKAVVMVELGKVETQALPARAKRWWPNSKNGHGRYLWYR